ARRRPAAGPGGEGGHDEPAPAGRQAGPRQARRVPGPGGGLQPGPLVPGRAGGQALPRRPQAAPPRVVAGHAGAAVAVRVAGAGFRTASTRGGARMRRTFLPAVCLAALGAAVPPAGADDWPAWRGPDGTGVSRERDLPLKWSADDNVRWKVKLPGPGNSTPIV